MLALMELVSPDANVIRAGEQQQIEAAQVVPGDIVVLESGQRLPADVRLLSTKSLQLDESLLTGESVPVGKNTDPVAEDAPLADRTSMGFGGAIVASGRASGIVVATGEDSELGRIAEQMRETEELNSPLQERMDRFAKIIGAVIVASAVLMVGLGLLLGQSLDDMPSVAAAVAVAAVPEGLPVVLTVALALGVRRMADHNAIIRRLPAVETLGSTMIIGSDKTGTLTQNQMSVEELWTATDHRVLAGEALPADPRDAEPREVPGPDADIDDLALLAGVLANEAGCTLTDDGVQTDGDPTEAAFLVALARHGVDPNIARHTWTETVDIPFESALRYAASYRERDGRHLVVVKGAPERVMAMCADLGANLAADAILEHAHGLAPRGLRVLATAYAELDTPLDDAGDPPEPSNLRFLALHGLLDPPREGVREAIAHCQSAGQRIIMITGDHGDTALAIAHQLGIIDDQDAPVLTGPELEDLDDERLEQRVTEVAVFARVDPEHKLRIVKVARRPGEVIAVTGDGVNDAPALKSADIGIAMGEGGTDVAREASELVLADDNFVSISAAIEEGRTTFDNVRKVTFFLISTGVGTFIVIPISMMIG